MYQPEIAARTAPGTFVVRVKRCAVAASAAAGGCAAPLRRSRSPRRSWCRRVAWWVAVRVGAFPRPRLEPRHAASLTVLDAHGNVLRQDATAAGGRESWVALGRKSRRTCATRRSPSRIAASTSTPASIWSAVARASWLDVTRSRRRVRRLDHHDAARAAGRPAPARRCAGKLVEMVARRAASSATLSKREILEQYLNRVYYGNGAWGAEQAARFYFGKPARGAVARRGRVPRRAAARARRLRSVSPPSRSDRAAPATSSA